jgi:Leucine-rich repeat (LRR) protein
VAVVFLLALLIGLHAHNEWSVATEVRKLGGSVEWEFFFVRSVYSLDDLDDNKLASLAKHLRKLTRLKSLSVAGSQVTDAGLEAIEELTTIQWLYLGQTRVSDIGMDHLARLVNLEYLDLTDTAVTDQGMKKLKLTLPKLKKIRRD